MARKQLLHIKRGGEFFTRQVWRRTKREAKRQGTRFRNQGWHTRVEPGRNMRNQRGYWIFTGHRRKLFPHRRR